MTAKSSTEQRKSESNMCGVEEGQWGGAEWSTSLSLNLETEGRVFAESTSAELPGPDSAVFVLHVDMCHLDVCCFCCLPKLERATSVSWL